MRSELVYIYITLYKGSMARNWVKALGLGVRLWFRVKIEVISG